MSERSFYDLDYIIEINERRLEQYTTAYQKVMERLTHILLIYSGMTIFLIPLVEDWMLLKIRSPVFVGFLLLFVGLLAISVGYAVKLLLPEKVIRLDIPSRYYGEYRLDYEEDIEDKNAIGGLLKASYISELENVLARIESSIVNKEKYHLRAIKFSLLSLVPYLVCLAFHLSSEAASVKEIEKIVPKIRGNFMERYDPMFWRRKHKDKDDVPPRQQLTNLPGIDNSLVKPSYPIYHLVGKGIAWTYDSKGNRVSRN